MVQILKAIFLFSKMKVWSCSKNLNVAVFFYLGKNYIFLNTWNAILMTTWCVFIIFRIRYHILLLSFTRVDVRAFPERISAELVLNQHCSFLKNQFSELLKSALNEDDSELIVAETALFSTDQRWIFHFWAALMQRKTERISSETEFRRRCCCAKVFQPRDSLLNRIFIQGQNVLNTILRKLIRERKIFLQFPFLFVS